MVRAPRKKLPPGAFVEVRSRDGEFVARGIYNPRSEIALRILTEDPGEELGLEFFVERFRRAKELREEVLRLQERTDAYRLVHGEADGLSGLVVDRFADVLVARPYSAGYAREFELVARALGELFPGARIAVRADDATARREGFDAAELARRFPAHGRVTIRENEIRMLVDLESPQKTGYFLDQRENRARFARLVRGRRVLDCFTYTGGFAISCARAGAARVTGVDLDEKALALARENAAANGAEVEFVHADVFDYLRELASRGEQVDALVLDPAKLAGVKAEVARAWRTYGDLNRLGVSVVREGGLILTCSCSGLVSERDFLSICARSAAEAGAHLQVFEVAGAAPDHPVASEFPEGRYLKAVFARVLRAPGTTRRAMPAAEPRPGGDQN